LNMNTIHLPDELIAKIIMYLGNADIIRATSANRQLRYSVVSSDHFWKKICLRTWKYWGNLTNQSDDDVQYNFQYTSDEDYGCLWRRVFLERSVKDDNINHVVNRTIWNQKERQMMLRDAFLLGLDVFEKLRDKIIASKLDTTQSGDLTFEYFGTRVIEKMHRELILLPKWRALLQLISQGEDTLLMLDVARIICDNFMLDEKTQIDDQIEELVNLVKLKLSSDLSSTPLTIIQAIMDVMVSAGFNRHEINYYAISNSYIDKVLELKKGIPITLSAVFQAIAARFDIRLKMIASPAHFMLGYIVGSQAVYIDAFNKKIYNREQAAQYLSTILQVNTDTAARYLRESGLKVVAQRMLNNLLTNMKDRWSTSPVFNERMIAVLSLYVELDDTNMHIRTLLYECNKLLEDVDGSFEQLQFFNRGGVDPMHFEASSPDYCDMPEPRYRPIVNDPVKYQIGQIIHHKRYNYVGVIYGWNAECEMSVDWQREMGVDKLSGGSTQPFYNVLVHNNQNSTYVAQENILTDCQVMVVNNELGRFFKSFESENTKYVPNKFTMAKYPNY